MWKNMFFVFCIVIVYGCRKPSTVEKVELIRKEEPGVKKEFFNLPFDLNSPSKTLELDRKLFEISGISWLDKDRLVAINDETGEIHIVSLEDGAVIDRFDFGSNDDYEGVSIHDSIIYVVESNGKVKVIDFIKREKIDEFDTYLSKRNDVEGLCHTPGGTHLLLACKGEMEDDSKAELSAVYRYDFENKKLDKKPFIVMDVQKASRELADKDVHRNPLLSITLKQRATIFGPSGIDYDPLTGLIYIVSSRGRTMVVTDKQGEIKGMYFLNQRLFGQPEGLTFDTLGNLYISNEARAHKANIQIMERIKPPTLDTTVVKDSTFIKDSAQIEIKKGN